MTDGHGPQRGAGVYRRLLRYSGRYWPVFLLAAFAMSLQAATVTSFAVLVQPLIDGTFVERDPTVIQWMPFAVLALFILRGVGGFVSTYGMEWIGRRVVTTMRQQLFDKILRLPASFFDERSGGTLLAMFTYNVEQVSESATKAVTIMVRDTLTLIGLVVWLLILSPSLSLFVLVIGPPVALLIRYTSKLFRRYSQRIQDSMGDVTRVAEESIRGNREIKIYGGGEYESDRFARENEHNRRAYMKQVLVKAASVPTIQFLAALGLASIIFVASRPASDFSPGQFSSFVAAMLLLMDPLKRLTDINAILQRGIAGASSIFAVIDLDEEPAGGDAPLARAQGRIEYSGVNFSYTNGDDTVLKDIEFAIEPGETVAFVGRSGSGKTTLVNLLPRFYDPDTGSVRLDGRDVRDYDLADLRRQIALVSQQVTLFNASATGNIAYGAMGGASEEDVAAAARAAHAWKFLSELPDGFDTPLGESGGRLSGGQRQRVAIARALLKDAPVLILDEATSALDTEAERKIQDALTHLMEDRTTLVIAHRLSTVENADRIVVMDAGRIVETGSHAELIERGGYYETLYRLQFAES